MSERFNEQMLEATFGFARVALSNCILLNGAAATALISLLSAQKGPIDYAMHNAILRFAIGAGLGGVASLLAYIGQRLNWEQEAHGRKLRSPISVALCAALAISITACSLFFTGCLAAVTSLQLR